MTSLTIRGLHAVPSLITVGHSASVSSGRLTTVPCSQRDIPQVSSGDRAQARARRRAGKRTEHTLN